MTIVEAVERGLFLPTTMWIWLSTETVYSSAKTRNTDKQHRKPGSWEIPLPKKKKNDSDLNSKGGLWHIRQQHERRSCCNATFRVKAFSRWPLESYSHKTLVAHGDYECAWWLKGRLCGSSCLDVLRPWSNFSTAHPLTPSLNSLRPFLPICPLCKVKKAKFCSFQASEWQNLYRKQLFHTEKSENTLINLTRLSQSYWIFIPPSSRIYHKLIPMTD